MKKIIVIGVIFSLLCIVTFSAGCIETNIIDETHSPFNKVTNHCYEVTYYDYDDSAMGTYAKILEKNPHEIGCSAVSNGNFTAHNFDYTYCDMATVIVHTTGTENRYATVGVSGWKKDWTPNTIENKLKPFDASFLPYTIVDGINEKGLVVCMNVVPAIDIGFTTCTNPNGENVLYVSLPRKLLDNCATVDECIEYLQNINIYNTDRHIFETHYLISDGKETCLVELIDNEVKISKDHHFMTNYYHLLDHLTDHSCGLERYDIIKEKYDSINTFNEIKSLMENLKYSRKYDLSTDPFWFSEYHGELSNDGKTILNKESPHSEFTNAIQKIIEKYKVSKRDSSLNVWKTIHTSIYNHEELTLSLYLNENYQDRYKFEIEQK